MYKEGLTSVVAVNLCSTKRVLQIHACHMHNYVHIQTCPHIYIWNMQCNAYIPTYLPYGMKYWWELYLADFQSLGFSSRVTNFNLADWSRVDACTMYINTCTHAHRYKQLSTTSCIGRFNLAVLSYSCQSTKWNSLPCIFHAIWHNLLL